MVTHFATAISALFAAEAGRTLIERLDLRSRIAVLAAILGIVLAGTFLRLGLLGLGFRQHRRNRVGASARNPKRPRFIAGVSAVDFESGFVKHYTDVAVVGNFDGGLAPQAR